ncbi:alkaline phosphatase family protein [Cohnella lupini]|uniref:Type I phosphodiesterase/nucleotide pyrophosphatase n=1 Tax=Cohnella lupini TaxID=1294267 RepID=A0A3D9IA64_9BACL|nr:alkaline phosphatase family protein [Cohnella lupini]RED58652.1 type I phosphodiesterase/nucleotide pyrophosphatase [Cohnella lupini]
MTQASRKLIVVVLDGLRYDTARSCMGYMEHLVEQGEAVCYTVNSELPSLSRPLYEVLLTGTPAHANGITGNHVVKLSKEQSVFHLASKANLRTAAAAYHWVSELYNSAPFNPVTDRHQHDENKPIQHGIFYFEDHYPDTHLFSDAEHLRKTHDPHFLYAHPMNIDDAGHKFGGESKQYEASVRLADSILALLIPMWLSEDYQVIVTSDHGMNAHGQHGGTTSEERKVPLYVCGDRLNSLWDGEETLSQLWLAPLMCEYLGIDPSAAMVRLPAIEPMRSTWRGEMDDEG